VKNKNRMIAESVLREPQLSISRPFYLEEEILTLILVGF
jgi:hypothetical protein